MKHEEYYNGIVERDMPDEELHIPLTRVGANFPSGCLPTIHSNGDSYPNTPRPKSEWFTRNTYTRADITASTYANTHINISANGDRDEGDAYPDRQPRSNDTAHPDGRGGPTYNTHHSFHGK